MSHSKLKQHLFVGATISLTLGVWTSTAPPGFGQSAPLLSQMAQANVAFSDISGNRYESEIRRAAQLGFIAGPGDGTFRPDNTVTREQAVSIILAYGGITDAQLAGISNPFRDVPRGRWSEAKIGYAAQNGIVAGRGNARFDPTAKVTRAELMAMLANAHELHEDIDRPGNPNPNFTFSDISGHWAEETVTVMASLCGGVARPLNESGNAFAPNTGATRAYTAAAIVRLADCQTNESSTASTGNNASANAADTPQMTSQSIAQGVGTLSQADINEILNAHNRYRTEVGLSPLTWSASLATTAQEWADQLAATGTFNHSSRDQRNGAGENLAWNTVPSLTGMVDQWGAEQANYIPGVPLGQASTTGNFGDIGHYTQIVWRDTTTVGCGLASGSINGSPVGTFLVCQYDPPGNFNNGVPY